MTKSPSQEPSKSSRRKGPRSVSTLTPSQLARKRANDREAQRAIRARTKEHIERLEQELEDAKSNQCRDKMVQELIERNKALEGELVRLRASMGAVAGAARYYNDGITAGQDNAIPSPRQSPFDSSGSADYAQLPPTYGMPFFPMPEHTESWGSVPNTVPNTSMPSDMPSPSSSSAHTDDFGTPASYLTPSMTASGALPRTSAPADDLNRDYESIEGSDSGYLQNHQCQVGMMLSGASPAGSPFTPSSQASDLDIRSQFHTPPPTWLCQPDLIGQQMSTPVR